MSFTIIILIVVGAVGLVSFSQSGARPPETGTKATSTAAVSSPDGLRLTAKVNATEIMVGQSLNVSLSIANTLPGVDSVKPSNVWLFHGVPVALWPPCYFGLPAQAAVVEGNYTLQDIQTAANVTFSYMCMEGVTVDHVIFQPNSDQVNLTGIYDVTGANQSLGPFHMSLSFTTGGYWNLQNLSREINIPIIGEQYPPRPPAYVPFVPGEYTIAVADEWGQAVVLHLTVVPGQTTCELPVEGTALYLQVVALGNGSYPIAGQVVTGTLTTCNTVRESPRTFVTNSSGYITIPSPNGNYYTFSLVYDGDGGVYRFNETISPLSTTYLTIDVPLGVVTQKVCYDMSTPRSCTSTTYRIDVLTPSSCPSASTLPELPTMDRIFAIRINYTGQWNATLSLYADQTTSNPPYLTCHYQGKGGAFIMIQEWNYGTPYAYVTVHKLGGDSGELVVAMNGKIDDTTAPFGSVTVYSAPQSV